ncbi:MULTISPECIES: RNA polymerase sigma factor [unclassified Leifsonia]|uniref:RNA polymerase sigma factor n=1 Tax=unclassified Leifsonia TaxID=2663824 RepID=UPI0008A7B101|nr:MULTISPECIES: RNA polymerase sigma factor [unclassified Leifsonia]SEI12185.1 RNA polymerase sigma-70 factor, ECF subfamily [Leifsonia sp. CL154]SFL93928.1 RNA polymerase sigma-70 factor, ECF subfamily [Leifsonia sp. CL147]
MDEASVLERVRGGDADAFGELFDLHHDRVFRQAIRLTSSLHDAEDVTAVVFLEAWRRRDAMRVVNDSVVAWLLVTTNFVFRNYARASRRYRDGLQQLPPPENAPDHADVVDDRIDRDSRRAALRTALASLPRRDQDILTLCVLEELSMADAAAALGVAPGTVKSRLSRAKARLTELLQQEPTQTNGGER